jgi:hypothetical protein
MLGACRQCPRLDPRSVVVMRTGQTTDEGQENQNLPIVCASNPSKSHRIPHKAYDFRKFRVWGE